MAVQNYFQGTEPLGAGYGNALRDIAMLKQRDRALAADEQSNALMQQRFQAGQDQNARLQEQEQTRALANQVYEGLRAKDPRAIEAGIAILGKISPMDPRAGEMFRQNPERLMRVFERQFGLEEAQKPQQLYQTEAGFLPADQAVGKMPYRAPQQPQQYAPETFSEFTDAEGNVHLIGSRGTIKPTTLKGPKKGSSSSNVSVGPNGELVVDPASIKASEGERKVAALGVRLEAALQNLDAIRARNPKSDRPTVGEVSRRETPIIGEMWANSYRSPDRQQADAAQTDALDAALTLATGAAYTKEQLEGLRKAYFPQVGDSEETVKFKEQQFKNIVQAARVNAGRAEPTIDAALERSGQSGGKANIPPPAALKQLQEGKVTTFANGQQWTLRNGQAIQVK